MLCFVFVFSITHSEQGAAQGELEAKPAVPSALEILEAAAASQARLTSAEGKGRVRRTVADGGELVVDFEADLFLAFSPDGIRIDRTLILGDDQLIHKQKYAESGDLVFQAVALKSMILDQVVVTKKDPSINWWPWDMHRFDIPRMMQPWQTTFEELITDINSGTAVVNSVDETDGILRLRYEYFGDADIHIELDFDPQIGMALVADREVLKGKLLAEIRRGFTVADGNIAILAHLSYAFHGSEGVVQDNPMELSTMSFQADNVNQPISQETFHFHGFDLPAGSVVVDATTGGKPQASPLELKK